jgi:hypothetical protein
VAGRRAWTAFLLCLIPAWAAAGDAPATAPVTAQLVLRSDQVGCEPGEITALDARADGSLVVACGDGLHVVRIDTGQGTLIPLAVAGNDQGTYVEALASLKDGSELVVRVELELAGFGTWLYAVPVDRLDGGNAGRPLGSARGFVARDAVVDADGQVFLGGTDYRLADATGLIVGIAPVDDRIVELTADGQLAEVAGGPAPTDNIAPGARCKDGVGAQVTFGRLAGLVDRDDGSVWALDRDCHAFRVVLPAPAARVTTLSPSPVPLSAPTFAGRAVDGSSFLVLDGDRLERVAKGEPALELVDTARAPQPLVPRGRPLVAVGAGGIIYMATWSGIYRLQ